jgi:hypothetical protein
MTSSGNTSGSEIEAEYEGGQGEQRREKKEAGQAAEGEMVPMSSRSLFEEA